MHPITDPYLPTRLLLADVAPDPMLPAYHCPPVAEDVGTLVRAADHELMPPPPCEPVVDADGILLIADEPYTVDVLSLDGPLPAPARCTGCGDPCREVACAKCLAELRW